MPPTKSDDDEEDEEGAKYVNIMDHNKMPTGLVNGAQLQQWQRRLQQELKKKKKMMMIIIIIMREREKEAEVSGCIFAFSRLDEK